MKKTISVSLLGLLACFGASMSAFADTAMSWNLARDVILAKESAPPGSPWSFMQNFSGVNKAENYILLPYFKADSCNNLPATCWMDQVFRWTSPVVGEINILGRVNSVHDSCGDGVAWSLSQGDTVLQSGSLVRGSGAVFSVSKVPVTQSSAIYLVLDKKANYVCDTSTIDMLITK